MNTHKLLLLLLVAGPTIYKVFRRAGQEWDGRQWGRWLLRVGLALAVGGGLITAALLLEGRLESHSRAASTAVFISLLGSGVIWGVLGLVGALLDLGNDEPFPHLYDRFGVAYGTFFTLMFVLGGIGGGISKELGVPAARGVLPMIGLLVAGLGIGRPAALWEDDRIVRLERHLGATGARLIYMLIGVALILVGLLAPESTFAGRAT